MALVVARLFILAALMLAAIGGISPARAQEACSLSAGVHTFSDIFEGVERSWDVKVPTGCDAGAPMPLVFDFHGLTSSKELQYWASGMRTLADQEGFVVVYPQGHGRAWNAGWCCSQLGRPSHSLDDVAFVRELVDDVSLRLPIDSSRVYATGLSNGGAMSHMLACEASTIFAAVAPVAFTLSGTQYAEEGCDPIRTIPVLQFHGFSDKTVPYEGSGAFPSAADGMARWAEINGCQDPPVFEDVGSTSYCEYYSDCDLEVEVGLCSIDGVHNVYKNTDGVDVGGMAWDFMSQHSLAVPEPGLVVMQLAALGVLAALRCSARPRLEG